MYLAGFGVDDRAEVRDTIRGIGFGHLVSLARSDDGHDRLEATSVPFLVDDELTTLRCHIARANAHWRSMDGADALVVVAGADTYVSPRWYPSKAEHGRVVPTWNYELINLRGTLVVHDDLAWKRTLVAELTDEHERRVVDSELARPWSVDDAPPDFIDRQLAAIIGVEIVLTDASLKRKLSQNREETDRNGVVAGLRRHADATGSVGAASVSALMSPDT